MRVRSCRGVWIEGGAEETARDTEEIVHYGVAKGAARGYEATAAEPALPMHVVARRHSLNGKARCPKTGVSGILRESNMRSRRPKPSRVRRRGLIPERAWMTRKMGRPRRPCSPSVRDHISGAAAAEFTLYPASEGMANSSHAGGRYPHGDTTSGSSGISNFAGTRSVNNDGRRTNLTSSDSI